MKRTSCICSVMCILATSIGLGRQAALSEEPIPVSAEHLKGGTSGCPSPVLPETALVLGQYANLELAITARRDGSIQSVVISKKSRARLYDEYTRKWVEQHWKMPPAKLGEPDVRKFIAPIVYPKSEMPPGGHYPPPDYPITYMRDRIEGLVIVEMKVAPSGHIESTRTVLSSGQSEGLVFDSED